MKIFKDVFPYISQSFQAFAGIVSRKGMVSTFQQLSTS